MLNGFQSRINKRNEKYFIQFLFFICTTKPSMSSHIRADRHSFHTIINNHWEYQHSKKLVGNKHIKTFLVLLIYDCFTALFPIISQPLWHCWKNTCPITAGQKKPWNYFYYFFYSLLLSNKLKANQNEVQHSHDIWNFISQSLLGEKRASLAPPFGSPISVIPQ